MKIQLDHIQRLSLHALPGVPRIDDSTIRALWATQGIPALAPVGEKALQFRRGYASGQEPAVWNPETSQPASGDRLDAGVGRVAGRLRWHYRSPLAGTSVVNPRTSREPDRERQVAEPWFGSSAFGWCYRLGRTG